MSVTTSPRSVELAISTSGLRKTYRTRHGKQVAVEGLDFEVPRGGVHGFLGPNGAGKTTTIRMLLGLIRPDSGTMRIFDQPVPQRLPDVIGKIGAIVESPKFFGPFSGRVNLQLAADAIGVPRSQVDRVLEEVQLKERGKDKFRTYSLGMKQRLAVAATLLKQPELLVFDEPTNGLDPAGIHEIRQTMINLGVQGRTVLVSSHILSEVEQVADTVSIIARGRLLASGTVSELVNKASKATVTVGLRELAAGAETLTRAGFAVRPGDGVLLVDNVDEPAHLTRVLAERGLFVSQLIAQRVDLESVFLTITEGATLGAPPGMPAPTQPLPPRRSDS